MKRAFWQNSYTKFQNCPLTGSNETILIRQNRHIFTNGSGTSGGGAPESAPEINEENLERTIIDMEAANTISAEMAIATLRAFKEGDEEKRNKILEVVQNNFGNKAALVAGLNVLLSIEEPGETPPPTTETATEGMAASYGIDSIRSRMSKRLEVAMETARTVMVSSQIQMPPENELKERLNNLCEDLKKLTELEEANSRPLTEFLNSLRAKGKLDQEEHQNILDLDTTSKDFETILEGVTTELTYNEILKLKRLKSIQRKIMDKYDEEIEQKISELKETLREAKDYAYHEANKKRSIDDWSRSTGIPFKEGAKLQFEYIKPIKWNDEGEVTGTEPTTRKLTIKDISFEDMKVKDENGKYTTFKSLAPILTIETEDADGSDPIEEKFTATQFKKIIDLHEVTEIIDSQEELEKNLHIKEIKDFQTFEYRQLAILTEEEKEQHKTGGNLTGTNEDVTIIEIKDGKVILDKPITLSSNTKKTELTFGEFAKWYKRVNAKEKMNLKSLQNELEKLNKERNTEYERKSKQYPPIKAEPGEFLYYDTIPRSLFKIESANDKEIVLDNGSRYTPATFLAWVANNHVEKRDPDAEANKITDPDKDPEGFAAAKAKQQKEQDRQDKERAKDGYVMADSETPPSTPSTNLIQKVWDNTEFLSLADLYEWGKQIYDWWDRKYEREKGEKIGRVGKTLAAFHNELGAEFENLEQMKENEHVNHLKQGLEQSGIDTLNQRLKETKNKYELKAILLTMADKGFIRWEDKVLWDAINRVVDDPDLFIHEYDEQKIKLSIDGLWGQDNFRDMYTKNNSGYENRKSGYYDESKRVENDPATAGGLRGRLQKELFNHITGESADPAVFEGYLHYAIEAGKLSFEDKIYFIMMGFGQVGPPDGKYPGKALLTSGRVSELEGKLLNNFPVLDYFTASKVLMVNEEGNPIMEKVEYTDANGNVKTKLQQKKGQVDANFVKTIIHNYIRKDKPEINSAEDCEPGINLQKFIQTQIMTDKDVLDRLARKASKDMSLWDHDDMHVFAPQIGESQIENMTFKGGSGVAPSAMALMNSFAGFNNYTEIHINEYANSIKTAPEKIESSRKFIINTLRSFVRLYACIDNRIYKGKGDRTRLTSELNDYPLVDGSRTTGQHINQVNNFLGEIVKVIGDKSLEDKWLTVNKKVPGTDHNGVAAQEEAVRTFGQDLEDAINQYGDTKFLALLQKIQKSDKAVRGPKNKQVLTKAQLDAAASARDTNK